METLEQSQSSHQHDVRQRLLSIIHQLPDNLVQEVVQFADYLIYRERHSEQPDTVERDILPEGKSEGYQKLKASGLIGFGEAEVNLSETYKACFAEEIVKKYDNR